MSDHDSEVEDALNHLYTNLYFDQPEIEQNVSNLENTNLPLPHSTEIQCQDPSLTLENSKLPLPNNNAIQNSEQSLNVEKSRDDLNSTHPYSWRKNSSTDKRYFSITNSNLNSSKQLSNVKEKDTVINKSKDIKITESNNREILDNNESSSLRKRKIDDEATSQETKKSKTLESSFENEDSRCSALKSLSNKNENPSLNVTTDINKDGPINLKDHHKNSSSESSFDLTQTDSNFDTTENISFNNATNDLETSTSKDKENDFLFNKPLSNIPLPHKVSGERVVIDNWSDSDTDSNSDLCVLPPPPPKQFELLTVASDLSDNENPNSVFKSEKLSPAGSDIKFTSTPVVSKSRRRRRVSSTSTVDSSSNDEFRFDDSVKLTFNTSKNIQMSSFSNISMSDHNNTCPADISTGSNSCVVFSKKRPLTTKSPSIYTYTREMSSFYDSDISEQLDNDSILDQMSGDRRLWRMQEDEYPSYYRRESSSCYESSIRCHRCREFGHMMRNCPRPPRCFLCSEIGHTTRNSCPNNVCLKCGEQPHYMCHKNHCIRTCGICHKKGHDQTVCPDIWRRFHVTTSGDGVNPFLPQKKMKLKPSREAYCYVCARKGHFGHDCPNKHKIEDYVPAVPYVTNYEIPLSVKKQNRKLISQHVKHFKAQSTVGSLSGKENLNASSICNNTAELCDGSELLNCDNVTKVSQSFSVLANGEPECNDSENLPSNIDATPTGSKTSASILPNQKLGKFNLPNVIDLSENTTDKPEVITIVDDEDNLCIYNSRYEFPKTIQATLNIIQQLHKTITKRLTEEQISQKIYSAVKDYDYITKGKINIDPKKKSKIFHRFKDLKFYLRCCLGQKDGIYYVREIKKFLEELKSLQNKNVQKLPNNIKNNYLTTINSLTNIYQEDLDEIMEFVAQEEMKKVLSKSKLKRIKHKKRRDEKLSVRESLMNRLDFSPKSRMEFQSKKKRVKRLGAHFSKLKRKKN